MERVMDKSARNSVLLVEGHDGVRAALGGKLRRLEDFDVLGDTSSPSRALDMAARLRPDLILVDFPTTAPYAAEICARIHQASPESRLVVFTAFADAETRMLYSDAGVTACLLKDIGFKQLIAELRALLRNGAHSGLAAGD
jgi:DNA-binding NarL/FixJ family response regulator